MSMSKETERVTREEIANEVVRYIQSWGVEFYIMAASVGRFIRRETPRIRNSHPLILNKDPRDMSMSKETERVTREKIESD